MAGLKFAVAANYRDIVSVDLGGLVVVEGPPFQVGHETYASALEAVAALEQLYADGPVWLWRGKGAEADFFGFNLRVRSVGDGFLVSCNGNALVAGSRSVSYTSLENGKLAAVNFLVNACRRPPTPSVVDWSDFVEIEDCGPVWFVEIDRATGALGELIVDREVTVEEHAAILRQAKSLGWRHRVGEAVVALARAAPSDRREAARSLLALHQATPAGQNFRIVAEEVGSEFLRQEATADYPIRLAGALEDTQVRMPPRDGVALFEIHRALHDYISICSKEKAQ